MSEKHTPGPWSVSLAGTMPNGVRMFWLKDAQVSLGSTRRADADLCAAAPAMKAALEVLCDDLEAELRDRWGDDPRLAHKLERDMASVYQGRAALALATPTSETAA